MKKEAAIMNDDSEFTLAPMVDSDVAELVVLQRCCWVPEAILNQNFDLPALHESAADVLEWSNAWSALCLRRGNRLVGAARARSTPDGAWDVGRLMVAPDLEGRGLGRWLLASVEDLAPDSATRFILFTGQHSERNIQIYQRAGYELCDPPQGMSDQIPGAVHLTKSNLNSASLAAGT